MTLDDVLALQALPQRYARAADARDVEALAALFAADATIAGARGQQSLDEWLETMRAPRAFPVSMHALGAPLIDVDESGDVATLDTYAVVHQLGDRDAGQADLTLGIRYVDRVARRDGRWVIEARTATTLWMR